MLSDRGGRRPSPDAGSARAQPEPGGARCTRCTVVHTLYPVEFQWDPKKAGANLRKHGVDFADAVAVFFDDRAITVEDLGRDERRFVTVGTDALGHVVVVSYA